jgi:hypothetical protein
METRDETVWNRVLTHRRTLRRPPERQLKVALAMMFRGDFDSVEQPVTTRRQ